MLLVVARLTVTPHDHHVRKRNARSIILVRVEEDSQALKLVGRPKNGALGGALLREPDGKAVSMQVPRAMKLELNLDLRLSASRKTKVHVRTHLPIRRNEGNARKDPSLLGRPVRGQADIPRGLFSRRPTQGRLRPTYLSVRMMVSPPKSHHLLCMSESKYGCAFPLLIEPFSHADTGRGE